MKENPRARKIADRIRQITVDALRNEVKDPRLGFVTITDVRVTGDLQNATVFYTVLGSQEEITDSGVALESAKGLIRRELGRGLSLRLTPSVEFVLDGLPENAASIEHLLDEARHRDAQTASAASSAAYAGEEDPYRKPDEEGEED
ncbi:MAG: 30S ribosome-binding factor RbfA [Agrococcus casei]|uniref:Ribosome-binding factor A n=1 Tax=Agrococcus casei LMG 22410 TaxID=1255656 RepID=A0A1R4FWE3_9MICO|nr:30S ribosome-binding factor RbfA [Agrococcus casei]SJM60153.1 Ribosome-binding factor A [Agrococcus casei LMG 22410]